MGRLAVSYTGTSARGHVGLTQTWVADGAYAGDAYRYDQWGNMTERLGWYKDAQEGFTDATYTQTFNAKNQLVKHPQTGATMLYDQSGNLKQDGTWALSYDATGQQTEGRSAGVVSLMQSYGGDRLRVKKVEQGVTTYYVRSSMLGGQVVAELDASGQHKRGYIYMGGQLLAIQENNSVTWAHQDPVTKSQRFTSSAGVMQSQRVDVDPWGVETNRSVNSQMQPRRFTTYERDANGSDEAMHRRYNSVRTRFDQPDPWDGSYELSDPQSFNRYSYVQNDPVNFIDPSGLQDSWNCSAQFASCGGGSGSGGQGYSGQPFDSLTYNYGGGGPTSINVAIGLAQYENWYGLYHGIDKEHYNPDAYQVFFLNHGISDVGKLEKALDSCLETLFGVSLTSFKPSASGENGAVTVNFTDPSKRLNGLTGFGVINDVTTYSRNSARVAVNDIYTANGQAPLPSNSILYGFTDPSSPYINFTVNNEKNPLNILKTQIHELGHSVEFIARPAAGGYPQYKEAGWELENCVAKKGGFKR